MFDLLLSSNSGVMLTRTEKLAKTRAVTATASSMPSVSCCTMCPGATVSSTNRFANNSSDFKWNGNGNQQGNQGQMSINLLSAKQAMLAMHRKCKSKSKTKAKTKLGSEPAVSIMSASPPYSCSAALQQVKHHLGTFPTANTIQSKPATHQKLIHSTTSSKATAISRVMMSSNNYDNITRSNQVGKTKKTLSSSSLCKMFRCPLPTLGATSFVTLLTVICIETVLLSNMSSCAKTFYMHWNTSNSM